MIVKLIWNFYPDDINLGNVLINNKQASNQMLEASIKQDKDDVIFILNKRNEHKLKYSKLDNKRIMSPIAGATIKFKGHTIIDLLTEVFNASKRTVRPNKELDHYFSNYLFEDTGLKYPNGQEYVISDNTKKKIHNKYMKEELTYYDLMTYKYIVKNFYFFELTYTDKKWFFGRRFEEFC
uniref:Uncharacterized protein n=1 Tax=viral metagenome TaxID=1070528 RepID=A0A6C0JB62_9ZZZZ